MGYTSTEFVCEGEIVMNKKLISLLVAICLVIGLLPVASIAADPEPGTAKLAIKQANAANTLEITEGGSPIYGKSVEFDAFTSTGVSKGKGYDYTITGVTSADWNFKFEYPAGGVPTLTLKDFRLVLAQENGNPLYTDDGDGTYTSVGSNFYGIVPRSKVHDLKIVLQGENVIRTTNGVIRGAASSSNKFSSLTIVGENGGSLTASGKGMGIQGKYGVPITIENATLNLLANSDNADAAPIYTADANITIKNSTITASNMKDGSVAGAIHAEGTGAINVENSTLDLTALGTAFNKAPVLSTGWAAVAGADKASATTVTDAAALAAAKYVKVTYPAPEPSTEATTAPTQTSAPTQTTAPTQTSAPTSATTPATTPTQKTASVKIMNSTTLTVTEGGVAKYAKSVSGTAYNAAGVEIGLYWTSAAGTESDWNVKFEYPMGGVPTLTFKDVTFDYYDDEGNIMYSKADGATKLNYAHSGVFPNSIISDLKIVLQGTNLIDVGYGIIRHSYSATQNLGNITVVGEPGSSLSGRVRNGAFNLSAGYDLTLENVNLDVWTTSGGAGGMPISVKDADLIINGGKLKVSNTQNCSIYSNGGNVFITNAEIETSSTFTSATNGAGAIHAGNVLKIANSTIGSTSSNGVALYGANGVTITGGTYNLNGAGFAVNGASIKINGGVVEATGGSSAFGKVPTISGFVKYDIKAGASKIAATLRETMPDSAKYVYVGPHTHVWGEAEAVTADCAGAGATKRTCTVCGAIEAYVEVAGTGAHNVVVDAAVPATCYLPGLTEGSHCGDCGVVIVEQKTVLPTGHTNLKDAVLSVFSNRYTYAVHCADCGDLISRRTVRYQSTDHPVDKLNIEDTKKATCTEEGYQKITISCKNCTENINTHTIILPKNPSAHTKALTAHTAVMPTHESDGNIAYWSCDDCGKYFADAAGTQELEKDSWILYKLCNHTGGTATCYAKAICDLCGRPYGKFADHTPEADDSDCTTPLLCSVPECRAVITAAMPHTGGTATCIKLAECEVCGTAYGNYAAHKGGTATCIALAKCEVCNADYGSYAAHTPTPDDGNLETPILCSVCNASMGLPAPNGDIIGGTPDIRYGYNNLRLSKYNEPKYLVNYSYTTEDTDGVEFTAWKTTPTGANEDNYNLKFYWNAGDPNPTIVLRGYKWDQFNEETNKIESTKKDGEYTGNGVTEYPMILLGDLDYDIILTGEDSNIGGQFGIYYTGELSVKSEGNTKLTMNAMTGCFAAWSASDVSGKGDNLTLDANLDLTSHAYYNATLGSGVISSYAADIIINGGTILCKTGESAKSGIVARESGNIIINGGKVVAHCSLGTSMTTGAIYTPGGKVTINGGMVETASTSTLGIYGAQGIDITGGIVQYYAPYFGMNVGAEANINITGGMVEIISENGAFNKMPVLGADITGYAGDNIRTTSAYDNEKNFKAKYVKIGVNVPAPDPANGPTMPGADPNNPGENPAAPSIEPTASPTAAPGKKLPKAVSISVGGVTMRITKFDTPIYLVNTPVEYREQSTKQKDADGNVMKDPDGNEILIEGGLFQGMKPTITTDENNWNAMFVWKSNEGIPTLYLNGLIIDDYNEETGKWRKYDNRPADAAHTTGIATAGGQYMRVVLTGEDSVFNTRFGINFKSKLRLESEGDTKLTSYNYSGAIYGAARMPLVVNANLDLNVLYYYNGPVSHPLLTNNADLTINGGKINLAIGDKMASIITRGSGNVIINGGEISAVGTAGTSPMNGAIQSDEKIIITGGKVSAVAEKAVAMYAKTGIDISGGIVNLTSPYYALSAGNKDAMATVNITGGTTTVVGERAVYNTGAVVVVGSDIYAYAGAGKRTAQVYDGTDVKLLVKPWFFATDDESQKIVIEEDDEDWEDEDIFDSTDATTAPTQPSATDATAAPDATEATTPVETIPEETIPEDEGSDDEYEDDDNYYNVTPNLDITLGLSEDIPDALIEMGFDSVEIIQQTLVDMVWAVDDYSDMFAFFDITLMYHDGEDWVPADEEHYPEDGYITVMLPYPEGTDIDTPFTAVHMYGSDAFGLTPGEVELLAPVNTDEGILVEMTGLSPVALAWEGLMAEENPPTGDTGVGLYIGLMVVAVLGMAGTVMLSNNKKRKAH